MTRKYLSLVIALLCISTITASNSALQPRASDWECDICSTVMDYVLLNPNASTEIEKLVDEFCIVLPTECEKVINEMFTILKYVEIALSRMEQFTGFELCSMINKCSFDCCLSSNPEQVHISFIDDPHNSMGVTWVTLDNQGSYVKYGTSPSNLNLITSGNSKTYTDKAWIGWIHNVALTNLQPGTKYYYSVGGNTSSTSGWSKVFSFNTESLNSRSQPLRIVEIGDMGAGPNSNDTMLHIINIIENQQADFIIHNGDISYADGFQGRWDTYFRKFEDAVANTPYMVTLGNHEIGIIGLLNLTIGYVHRFMLPGPNSLSYDYSNLYYSWNYGLVHFISLDTENILDLPEMTPQQLAWLEGDLASVNRQQTPWIIVYGHRPLYCSNPDEDCTNFAGFLRQSLEGLFFKYSVDLVFSGHKHDYERFWPTYDGKPVKSLNNPGVPMYVLNGAGGNREGNDKSHKPQDYSYTFIPEWGYGMLIIHDSKTLEWSYYRSSDNSLLDNFTLINNH